MIPGDYYLHANGSLIYKRLGVDDPDSTFITAVWNAQQIGSTPARFVQWLCEAKKLGAKESEIKRLATENKLREFVPDWESILELQ